MNLNSFDMKLLFLSFLDSYQNSYTFTDNLSPIFKFLAVKGAFAIAAQNMPEELRKDFLGKLN